MAKNIAYYQKKLKEREEEFFQLRKIGEIINYNWNLDKILQAVIDVIHDYTNSHSCFIYLLDTDSKKIVLRASQNPHKKSLGKISMKLGEGITGWVAQHQKVVILPHAAYEDQRFKLFNSLPEDRYEAFISLPIILKGKTIGVINIQHRKKKKYSKEMVTFLEIIAHQVAGAIETAQLLSETHILKDALQTRKLVDKAKGILMREFNLNEEAAHKLLNKKSMDNRKSLKEIAEAVILADSVFAKK